MATSLLHSGSSSSDKLRRKNNVILDSIGSLALPALLAGFFLQRHLKSRKSAAANQQVQQTNSKKDTAASAQEKPKPRREYKIKRDRHLLAAAAAEERQLQLQQQQREAAALGSGDNVMEAYNEDEVEALQKAQDSKQANFLNMLQQMGFRVVAPQDGSDQVFLVPQGAEEGEEEDEGEEGELLYDEGEEELLEDEGYDEDEDAGEEEVEA